MKHPKPDIADSIQSSFIANVGTIRKLLKYWDTTVVGGVPVLAERQYYHPWSGKEKLFRFLGIYEDVTSADMKGIDSAWVYFNKSKEVVTDYSEDINDFIVHNLNLMWWDPDDGDQPENLTLTTDIVIEGKFQSNNTGSDESDEVSLTDYLDLYGSKEDLINSVVNHYEGIWDTALISQYGVGVINKGSILDPTTKVETPDEDDLSPNDPWLDTIARYALRTNGVPCTVIDVVKGMATTESSPLYNTYVVTLEIPYIKFTSGMGIVTDIATDIAESAVYTSKNRNRLTYANGYYTKQAIRRLNTDDLETDPYLITRPYMFWSETTIGLHESIWHKEGGSLIDKNYKLYLRGARYYLKADVLQHPRNYGFTYKELVTYLLPLLDTGYKKKKVPWWKKLVAAVVFVIAIILSPYTGGTSLALAKTVLFAVFVVTVLSFVFAQLGMTEWAMAFAEVNKMVEPLAWVAMVVLIITGVSAAYESLKTAAQEAGKTSVKEFVKDIVTDAIGEMVDDIVNGATELFAGNVNSISLEFLQKVGKLVSTVQKFKLESINDKNKDLKAEYERLTADAELESDVLRGFARIYASPATADWSMYTGIFDIPYEGTGGPLHTGNAQRTTKQALRKATYDNYVFNDILII